MAAQREVPATPASPEEVFPARAILTVLNPIRSQMRAIVERQAQTEVTLARIENKLEYLSALQVQSPTTQSWAVELGLHAIIGGAHDPHAPRRAAGAQYRDRSRSAHRDGDGSLCFDARAGASSSRGDFLWRPMPLPTELPGDAGADADVKAEDPGADVKREDETQSGHVGAGVQAEDETEPGTAAQRWVPRTPAGPAPCTPRLPAAPAPGTPTTEPLPAGTSFLHESG